MNTFSNALQKVDSSAKVVTNSSLELLEILRKELDAETCDHNVILSKFTQVAKQVESLWEDIDANCFSLVSPLPMKSIQGPFVIPQLLSSMITKDDEDAIIYPDTTHLSSTILSTTTTTTTSPTTFPEYDSNLIEEHNSLIDSVLEEYQILIDSHKLEMKRKVIEQEMEERLLKQQQRKQQQQQRDER